MEFTVFGEITATDRGRPIALGGPRQRLLLAVLLTEPNRVVGTGAIIDAVWDGEDPPEWPERAVRTYVSRLRKTVGPDRLESTTHGFRLVVGDGELDTGRFVKLVEAARSRRSAGDLPGAARIYGDAAALFIGRPWAELADRFWARAEVERLERLRLYGAEEQARCLLDVGEPARALEVVEPLLADDPLNDGLRAVQLLALHRLGRIAEASRAFQAHRERVVSETGLEPSTELAELEASIVRGDPELDRAGPVIRGYELVEQLRADDTAVVWRARQPGLDRDVLLEVIDPELANEPEFIRNFEIQTRLLARLDGGGPPLIDAWRDYRGAFVVSPYFPSVAEVGPENGWTSTGVRRLVADLGRSMAILHDRGHAVGRLDKHSVALTDDGSAVILGLRGSNSGTSPQDEVRSLAALGLRLLERSGDLDTTLHETLTRTATGVQGSGRVDRTATNQSSQVREGGQATNRGETSGEQPGDLARRLVAAVAPPLPAATDSDRSATEPEGRNRPHPRGDGPDPTGRNPEIRNPYKGLRSFDIADADDFYGRKNITDELVQRVLGERFVVVVGPSGSGKSSVVRAGVLPALIRYAELGGRPWFGVTMVPGHDPFESLEAALLRIAVNPPATLREQLTGDSRGIIRAVERSLPDDRSDLLLLVDQFEELWTATADEFRQPFVAALVAALTEPDSRVGVVATLRADLYDRPLAHPELGELLAEASVPLPALSAEQMEQVVTGPAAAVGLGFQPSVVAEFVRAGTSSTTSLPLIQFALTELVDKRTADLITADDLHRLGGIPGSIGRRAEQTYQGLDEPARSATRRLFGRLVNVTTAETTRRRALRSELTGDDTDRAVDGFVAARLLTLDRDQESREPTVEVAHEALLSSWPRLSDWVAEDADELRVVSRLVGAAARWEESGRDDGELLRGAPLAAAVALAGDHPERLSVAERGYVDAGRERLEAEQNRERQRSRRLRNALAVAAVLLAVSVITGGVAVVQRNAAQASAFEAESTRLASTAASLAGTDPSLALLVAAEAYRRSPNPETLGGLQRVMIATDSFLGHRVSGEAVRKVFWVDDDRLAVITADDVQLVEATTGDVLDEVSHALSIDDEAAAFVESATAHHGPTSTIAAATTGGSVAIYRPDDNRLSISTIAGLGAEVRSLAFDPAGELLYAGDADGFIHEVSLIDMAVMAHWSAHDVGDWKPPDGMELDDAYLAGMSRTAARGVIALAVTDDAVVSSGAVELATWDRTTRRVTDRQPVTAAPANGARLTVVLPVFWLFPAEGDAGAVNFFTGADEYIGKLDTRTGDMALNLAEGLQRTATTQRAVDATMRKGLLYTAADDGGVRVLDVSGGQLVDDVIVPVQGLLSGVAISENGKMMAVGTQGGVSLIALDGSGLLNAGLPLGDDVQRLTAAPTGSTVAATTFVTGATEIFDRTSTGYRPRDLAPDRELGYIELLGHRTSDPDVILEWRASPDGTVVRPIDRHTLEPLANWVLEAYSPLVNADQTLSYNTHLSDLVGLPGGQHRIWIHSWPDGEAIGDPVEFETDGGLIQIQALLDEGRLLVGARRPIQAQIWAIDTEKGEMVEPPFQVDGGVFHVRLPRGSDRLYVVRNDGAVEERDAETYKVLRTAIGPEPPVSGDDPGVVVDDSRDLWLTINNKNPRLIDAETGRQIGDKFPHDNRDILLLPADGADGEPIQLVTSLGEGAAVWNLATETWYDIACQAAGRNFTVQEWELVGPRDRESTATCPQWPART